jgi:hypothetical protein
MSKYFYITNSTRPANSLYLVFNSILTYLLLNIAFDYYSWDQSLKIILFTLYTILNILRIIMFVYLSFNIQPLKIDENLLNLKPKK